MMASAEFGGMVHEKEMSGPPAVGHVAGHGRNDSSANGGDQLVAFLGGPLVQPDDRGAQRRAIGVAGHDAVDLAAKTHRDDPIRLHAFGRGANGGAQRGAVDERILVGPAVVLMHHRQRRRAGGDDLAALVDDHGLDALRADVDSQDQRHALSSDHGERVGDSSVAISVADIAP